MKIQMKAGLIIATMMVCSYFYDAELFRSNLSWLMGGAIVLLLNVGFFGNIIAKVMENEKVKHLSGLFEKAVKKLDELLEIKNGKN
jgi:hypothetical protein